MLMLKIAVGIVFAYVLLKLAPPPRKESIPTRGLRLELG